MFIRVRATGQVLDMIPRVATAMLAGGTAELCAPTRETSMLNRAVQTAAKFIKTQFPGGGI
jgi:hypothetical protein